MKVYTVLLTLLMSVFLLSCSGGKILGVVPPEVNVSKTPTITLYEACVAKFGPAFKGFFESYDEEHLVFIRVEWLEPSFLELASGDFVTFGVEEVYVKVFDPITKTYLEVPVKTYREVYSVLVSDFANLTNTKFIYDGRGCDLAGAETATVTVGWEAEEWTILFNKISGGVLSSIASDYGVTIETKDGYVSFRKGDDWTVVGAIWVARGVCLAAGGCPEEVKSWDFSPKDTPIDRPPTADFTADPTTGEAPLDVVFDGSGSSDPDGDTLVYDWWFRLEGETTGDVPDMTGEQVEWTFAEPGRYRATLRVYDNEFYASETVIIVVTDPDDPEPENVSPVAAINIQPVNGYVPLKVNLDGSGSSDSDGEIIRYTWEIQGAEDQSGVTKSHIFNEPGVYTVILEVEDNDGATDRAESSVTVYEPDPENLDWYLDKSLIESTYAVDDSWIFAEIKAVVNDDRIGFLLWESKSGPTETFVEPKGGDHPRLTCELWVPVEGMTDTVEATVKVTPFADEASHDAGDPSIGEPLWFILVLSPEGAS